MSISPITSRISLSLNHCIPTTATPWTNILTLAPPFSHWAHHLDHYRHPCCHLQPAIAFITTVIAAKHFFFGTITSLQLIHLHVTTLKLLPAYHHYLASIVLSLWSLPPPLVTSFSHCLSVHHNMRMKLYFLLLILTLSPIAMVMLLFTYSYFLSLAMGAC